ncbi:MAG: hypothetical protein AB7N65_14180 [Vicinamibacterales bacterium]
MKTVLLRATTSLVACIITGWILAATSPAAHAATQVVVVGTDSKGRPVPLRVNDSGELVLAQMACERNTLDPTVNGYCVVFEDWNSTAVDVSVDSTVVSPVPSRLGCITVNTALSAHDLPIKDNTGTICTVPASAGVGTSWCGCKGTRADTNLTADPNDAATGNVNIQWRPQ